MRIIIKLIYPQIPYPHPWPTHNPLADQCVTNELLDPGLASNSMFNYIFFKTLNKDDKDP